MNNIEQILFYLALLLRYGSWQEKTFVWITLAAHCMAAMNLALLSALLLAVLIDQLGRLLL